MHQRQRSALPQDRRIPGGGLLSHQPNILDELDRDDLKGSHNGMGRHSRQALTTTKEQVHECRDRNKRGEHSPTSPPPKLFQERAKSLLEGC